MDWKKIFDTFLGMVKLEPKAYKAAAKNDFKGSLMNFALAAIAVSLSGFWVNWDVLGLVGGALALWILYIPAVAIGVGIVWIFAKLLGGKAKYSQHYNTGSYLVLAGVPIAVPIVGGLIAAVLGLWAIVMHVFVIRDIHKLSTGRAVAAIAIPYIIVGLILAVLVIMGMAALLAMGGLEGLGLSVS